MDNAYSYSTVNNVVSMTEQKKKLKNRSRSSYGTSAKKSRNIKRNGSNLSNNTMTVNHKNKKEKKSEYNKARMLLLIAQSNNDLLSCINSKTSSNTNLIYSRKNISSSTNSISIPLSKSISFKGDMTNKAKNEAKIKEISEMKSKFSYLLGICLYRKRRLKCYKTLLIRQINNEMKMILSQYINVNFQRYYNQQLISSSLKDFDTYENNTISNQFLSSTSQGVLSSKENRTQEEVVNNIKKKAVVNKSAFKSMKSSLTPFPKKKDQTKIDDIYYQKASGAANLIRRIEYSNYLKSVKNKISKELLIKKTIMIQRWWRNMLLNNTFYYKIMVIQKIFRGFVIRKSKKEAKKIYYNYSPGIKKVLLVVYKELLEKMYNKLLNRTAVLYQYKETKRCVQLFTHFIREYIEENKEIIEEMKKNGKILKRYVHLQNYFNNVKRYKDFVKKNELLQRKIKRLIKYGQLEYKKRQLEFHNDKIKREFISFQIDKLSRALLITKGKEFLIRLSHMHKSLQSINDNRICSLNKIFIRFRMRSAFDSYKYKTQLQNIKERAILHLIQKLLSCLVYHSFISNCVRFINSKRKNCLLRKYVNKKNKKVYNNYFTLLKCLTFYKISSTGQISKSSLYLFKFIIKTDLRLKKKGFNKWKTLLSKNKMSNFKSGLLIIKNVLLKKISTYFFTAKNNFINKPKRLRRVTRIFTNENSKIYFVSGKSVIHSKLRKIVQSRLKLEKLTKKIYFLKFVSLSHSSSLPQPLPATIKKHKNTNDEHEKEYFISSSKKFILRSIVKQYISKSKLLLSEYFTKFYHNISYSNNQRITKRTKRRKVSFILDKTNKDRQTELLINLLDTKQFRNKRILKVFYITWYNKARCLFLSENARRIQKKYKKRLGPLKQFALHFRRIILQFYLRQISIQGVCK